MESLRSQRFPSYIVGLAAVTGLVVLAMILGIPLESLDGALGIVAFIVLGQLGVTNAHDAVVRRETIRQSPAMAAAQAGLATAAAPAGSATTTTTTQSQP